MPGEYGSARYAGKFARTGARPVLDLVLVGVIVSAERAIGEALAFATVAVWIRSVACTLIAYLRGF